MIESDFLKGKTILIADDEELNFMLIEELLCDTQAILIHAINGLEAVEIFKKNPQIDVVLMDLRMPEMDGYEATRQIKEISSKIPVIAHTAFVYAADEAKVKSVGCDALVNKPINIEILLEVISGLLFRNNKK